MSSPAMPRPSGCSWPPWNASCTKEIGLEGARNETEVVPACTSVQNFSPQDFEGCMWVPDGNIKLSGSCDRHPRNGVSLSSASTSRRPVLARGNRSISRCTGSLHPSAVLYRLGQSSLLLQNSPSYGFRQFASNGPIATRLVESSLSDDDWRLASVLVARWGMPCPPRSPAGSQELRTQIWSGFDEYDIDGGLQRSDTESSLFSSFQRRYLRVLQHTLPEKPVGQDRSNSLPQLVGSVTGALQPDTFLPQSNSWSWCMAPCPTGLPRVSHPITLISG